MSAYQHIADQHICMFDSIISQDPTRQIYILRCVIWATIIASAGGSLFPQANQVHRVARRRTDSDSNFALSGDPAATPSALRVEARGRPEGVWVTARGARSVHLVFFRFLFHLNCSCCTGAVVPRTGFDHGIRHNSTFRRQTALDLGLEEVLRAWISA